MNLSALRYAAEHNLELNTGPAFDENALNKPLSLSDLRSMMLNETFYGRKPVADIERIMGKIVVKIKANPMVDINAEPEGAELDAALVRIFGFKSAHVFWAMDPSSGFDTGPWTQPTSRSINEKTEGMKYGNFKERVYDKDHSLVVFIQLWNSMVSVYHMTAAESTAILLHEVGHNFDYSPYALAGQWVMIITLILEAILKLKPKYLGKLFAGLVINKSDTLRSLYMQIHMIPDVIARAFPDTRETVYKAELIIRNILKPITILTSPIRLVTEIPKDILFMPITWIVSTFSRKSERYADSMATLYGYGPEMISALEKMNMRDYTSYIVVPKSFPKFVPTTIRIFDNLALLTSELVDICSGVHTTSPQRARSMIDNIKRELDDPNLDAGSRKACEKELARLEKMYDKVAHLDDNQKTLLIKLVRETMDSYYKKKDPDYMHILGPDYTYVK